MAKKRDLTPEEKRLWRYVTRADKRLHKPLPEEFPSEEEAIEKPDAKPVAGTAPAYVLPARKKTPPGPLKTGEYANIDRATAEKFRRGQYPIDARLDLHGHTQSEAREALAEFLHRQYHAKSRCLLVITGKGRGQTKGVLRDALPAWVADMRQLVLAFDIAKPKHGGEGAYYILLRRKR